MAYYSKYSGKEVDERLDRVDSIPTKISQLLNDKDYITEIELKAILDKIPIVDFSKIPIDEDTIYWSENSDGKLVLKSKGEGEDSNWSVKKDSNGNKYIYTELPVVTQYGVTMYGNSGDINLPSLYAGLPIDNQTIYWDNGVLKSLGGGEGLNEEALRNYLLINGYVTESWVLNLGYIGPEGLKNYVDISSNQDINGKKNFKSGISINGLDIYQSQDDVIYIDANLVVRGGITMFSDRGDVDIPSIAQGLPFDNRTIWYNPDTQQIEVIGGTGGGSGEGVSNFWDLSGIPSWITNTKPAYSYTEIQGTPDLSVYALKSYVDDELTKYVTLGDSQEIKGEKDFTGGLKVNGSTITYDKTNKYWKLEGDLLVTGGVTMYGSDSSFTPSTIMDAILYDDATLGINSNGELYVKGGTSGGGLDITALQNYLTQNSYLNVTEGDGRYLKLSGGMITGENDQVPLAISNTASTLRIGFVRNNEVLGYLGFIEANEPLFYDKDGNGRLLLHERNFSSYALPLTGGRIVGKLQIQRTPSNIAFYNADNVLWGHIGFNAANNAVVWDRSGANEYEILHRGNYSSYALPLSGGEISSTSMSPLTINTSSQAIELQLKSNSNIKAYIGWSTIDGVFLQEGENAAYIGVQTNKNPYYYNGTRYTLWHEGNFTPSNYLPLSGGTINGNIQLGDDSSTSYYALLAKQNGNVMSLGLDYGYGTLGYRQSGTTNWNLLSVANKNVLCSFNGGNNWNIIWHSGNDGSGSGLDADLLDGKNLSDIIRYEGLNNNGNAAASAQTITYWGEGNWGHGSTYGTSLNIQGAGSWNHRIDFRTDGILDYYQGINTGDMTHIGAIAFTSSNVASATKLQTARTIWGQSFDGTGDIEGAFRLIFPNIPGDAHVVHSALKYKENPYGLLTRIYNDGAVSLQVQRESNVNEVFTLLLNPHGGNVGVGTANPLYNLHVVGNSYIQGVSYVANYISFDYKDHSINNEGAGRLGTFDRRGGMVLQFGTNTSNRRFSIIDQQWTVELFSVDDSGNVFANGGITMYSDKRKKTILNHVELSLKQIANAPLIEHYYNGDEKKTTHVGSIAQYWASMNDWFCKLDSEGYYTMEIQNAALASAISIARELDRYETKTDKAIKKLKKRISELEDEVERLKSA